MEDNSSTNIDSLIAHIKEWNDKRYEDIQAIMNNPAGEWERGIMLSNAHGQDIQQLLKYCLYLATIIKNMKDNPPHKEIM